MEMLLQEKRKAKRREISKHISELEPSLCSDMEPAKLVASVERVIHSADGGEARIHDDVLFNLPYAQCFFDAWIVGKYGELFEADLARLSGDIWPDGVVTIQDQEQEIEVTEALQKGRRRGDEYRADRPRYGDGGPGDWNSEAAAVPHLLMQAISKKIKKKYSVPSTLVVYLNVNDYGTNHKTIETHIRQCRFNAAARFEAVFVLWKGKLYEIQPEDTAP